MTECVLKLIDCVESSLKNEDRNLPNNVIDIVGYSDVNIKYLLHNLLKNSIINNYLEIGVWKGSTAIPALYDNYKKIKYWLIDNWSEFNGSPNEFIKNFKDAVGIEPNIIHENCFHSLEVKNISNVDVYFYDGGHEEEDHYKSVTHFYDCMNESFILIVDDWNWKDRVESGTYRGIKDKKLKIEKFWSFPWWNGIGVFVLSK